MEITQEYLKECFDYDVETGDLIWRARPRGHFKSRKAYGGSRQFEGRIAGKLNKWNGYRYIHISAARRSFFAHRLVWFWHFGRFPVDDLDHINRNRSDNRVENLRECTRSQNLQGRQSKRLGLSRGVRSEPPNRWSARIWVGGKERRLGSFKSEKDAALAYARAAVDHFGKFAPIEAKELFNEAYP